jgi:hypothetical protein
MKTKTLIKLLQENDPSGELECCIENADILDVWREPAYYDGCLQVLIRDEENKVIEGKIIGTGTKVIVYSQSISDVLLDYPDFKISYDEGMSDFKKKQYEASYAKERQEKIDISNDVECGFFQTYWQKREPQLDKDSIKDFYNKNMRFDDSMPEDIAHRQVKKTYSGEEYDVILSWNERRSLQWDRELEVVDGEIKKIIHGTM